MSDKVKWGGSRIRGDPWPTLMVDRYVAARVDVDGTTHLGRVTPNGVIVQVCETVPKPILLPVAYGDVDCEECRDIMRRKNLFVNTTVRFEQLR